MVNQPGSTEEQLPDEILALIPETDYLSTGCQTGHLLDVAILKNPGRSDLVQWKEKMHRRCRLNHKFLGTPCLCNCHTSEKGKNDGRRDPQKAGLGTDRPQT